MGTITVGATAGRVNTGIIVRAGQRVHIRCDPSDRWNAHPAHFQQDCDANGHPGSSAASNYPMPGHHEGIMVASLYYQGSSGLWGHAHDVAVGIETTFTAPVSGTIYLTINDDLNASSGSGLADNRGSIQAAIAVI